MPERELEFQVAGENVLALAERALFWPRTRTLFVADVHFGKDATFRHALRWVPPGTTADDISRLSALVTEYGAERLVILGDTFHSEHAREEDTLRQLQQWRAQLDACVVLVKGNHDRRAAGVARTMGCDTVEEGHAMPPFFLHHHPLDEPAEGYALCGHVHPVVVTRGMARQRLRLRCFWIQKHQCVLPAFGGFTGGHTVTPSPDDRVILVAGGGVLEAKTRARG
ncbi:MAG TPA: ligase-associated DNA damage response endonuclease PdeM [Verrucomicrobiae bacterium]|nr:ligase-associated DNA damage response endonuclease PdeM [Verrucomicrobiae bacterium]